MAIFTKRKKAMQKSLFNWLDTHQLTQKEVEDFDYLEDLISNWEEEHGELEEEEAINHIFSYQKHWRENQKATT